MCGNWYGRVRHDSLFFCVPPVGRAVVTEAFSTAGISTLGGCSGSAGSSVVEIGENCRQIAEPLEELFDRTGAPSNEELQPWSDCPLMTLSHLSAFAPVQGQSIVFTDGEESEAAALDSTTVESSPGSG